MRLSVIRAGSTKAETLATSAFACKFSESVRGPPWHRMSATYGLGFGDAVRGGMPEARDWLAIEERPGFARMIGRVITPQARTGGGPNTTSSVTVEAEGFFDAARANDVVSSPGARVGTVGTLFDYEDWLTKAVGPYVDTFEFGDLGPLLKQLIKTLVRMEMPPALLKGSIGDAIYVLHNPDGTAEGSARLIGSTRTLDPVRGFNVGGVRSMLKTQGKAIDLLMGTFGASELLVEMFPSLEPAPDRRFSGDLGPPEVLGNYLTVVYRFKPWRVRALSLALREAIEDASPPATFFTPAAYADDPYAFDRETWTRQHEARAPLVGAPFAMTAGKRNDDIVNAASAWLTALAGGDDLRVFEALGLPILRAKSEIERDGFRMAAANWPFLPSPGTKGANGVPVSEQDVFAFVQRLTAAIMQLYSPAAELFSGNFSCGLDLRVRAGEIVRIPVPGGGPMAAYVDQVEHSLRSDEAGVVTGTTTVQFSRGAFDIATRDVDVAVYAIKQPQEAEPDTTGGHHAGVVFGGKEWPIILDWPWVIDSAEVIADPNPITRVTLEKVYGTGVQWAVQTGQKEIRTTVNPLLTGQHTRLELPVTSEERLFVFGDDQPSKGVIQDYIVGPNLNAQPANLKVGIPLKPGAFVLDAPFPGFQVVAATGEDHGSKRPGVEELALKLDKMTGDFGLRDPNAIRYVILHAPGAGLQVNGSNHAIATFRGNFRDAIDLMRIAGSDAEMQQRAKSGAVSAHFVIDRKGCVWQLQDGYRYAIHTESFYQNPGSGGADWINQSSIAIELVVPSANASRKWSVKMVNAERGNGREYPNPEPTPIPPGGDKDCRRGGVFPEGGLVNCSLVRHPNGLVQQNEVQPSRQQYRALGALLSVIKRRCPNFQIGFPGQPATEFSWQAIPPNGQGRYDAATLPAGIYVHATLRANRTDHLGIHRGRVLAYAGDGSADERNRRTIGDTR